MKLASHFPSRAEVIVVSEIFLEHEPNIKTEQSSSNYCNGSNNVDVTNLIHLEGC
jgi:hypothetical protein